jgi:SnoaL-like domain
MPTDNPADQAAITELYKTWCAAWLKFPDISLMLSLFDQTFDPYMIYQAEENPSGLTTYGQIESYWQNAHKLLEVVTEWKEEKQSIAMLSPTSACIWVEVMTALRTTVMPNLLKGKIRASIGVRKTGDKWSIVHYHESRQLLAAQDEAGNWRFFVDLTVE